MRSAPLPPGAVIGIDERPARELEPPLRARVAQLFAHERATRTPALFDGRLFSLEGFEGPEAAVAGAQGGRLLLRGRFVGYSEWVAQVCEPRLAPQLCVTPLGVTGLIVLEGGVLLGRRSHEAFAHRGLWELAPSGGLAPEARVPGRPGSAPSVRRQLALELEEELGWPARRIASMRAFALVEDPELRVVDVAYEIGLAGSRTEVEAAIALRAEREYEEVIRVPIDRLGGFVAREGAAISPVSRALLRARGWLAA